MRKLIAAMKISVDEKIEGSEGHADWVEAWSEDYGLTPLIAGEGKALFANRERRRALQLRQVQQLSDGRVSLIYGVD